MSCCVTSYISLFFFFLLFFSDEQDGARTEYISAIDFQLLFSGYLERCKQNGKNFLCHIELNIFLIEENLYDDHLNISYGNFEFE